ncbi:MAG: Holliday junction resolvase RuvX [Burkholderiales bacterium]|nr:Holliday junction resolvase RuvX [Burkholderiales bacterium]
MSTRPARGAVLAFDFGEKRIGVAVGEIELAIPHPLTVIDAEDNDRRFAAIAALIAEWHPVRLVVGIASHVDGGPHETGRLSRRFGQRLHGRFGLPVDYVDERLSSQAADAALRESGTGAGRRAAMLDAAAAAEILRTWFTSPPEPAA